MLNIAKAPFATLERIAPVLRAMLLGERTVLLNRAAAEPYSEVGAVLSAGRRDIAQLLLMQGTGRLHSSQSEAMLTQFFVCLLMGDQQIKRLIGVMPEPVPEEVSYPAGATTRAFAQVLK